MKININLNYEASFEVSNISLDLDKGYDGDNFMNYRFRVSISYGKRQYEIVASQLMCFYDLQPPAEDIFPENDIDQWKFTSYHERTVQDSVKLDDIEIKIMGAAIDKVCNDKDKVKEAYIKFWTEYAQDAKKSALQDLKRAEKLQEKIDGFLETLKDM
jgi:hypothetical protein